MGTGQTRSHNKQNQITSIQNLTTPMYDANGNMTGDENGKTLVFDAWNRFVAYKNGSTTLVSNAHDALGRRVIENPGTQTDLFYSAEWQVLEEREGTLVRSQNVWSPVYIDAMILRDRDADGNGTLEERLYVQHDANYNVSAIVSTSGVVLERYAPDAYGAPKYLNADFSSRSSSGYDWIYIHQGGRFQLITGLYHFRNRELSAALGRWVQVDPITFRGGDVNLLRYEMGSPTQHLDSQGKCAAQAAVCKVDKVTLVTKQVDIPAAAKGIKFPEVPREREIDLNVLGPYNDPKKTGVFFNVHWVVFEGQNLSDCVIRRYVIASHDLNGKKSNHPSNSDGFKSGAKITAGAFDGPNPRAQEPKNPTTIVVIADAPGGKIADADFPFSYEANFWIFAQSKTDHKIKGQIWYDVVILGIARGRAAKNEVVQNP